MGAHFVFGETIEAAIRAGAGTTASAFRIDMLGEGARTAEDAERYFEAYAHAIRAIGDSAEARAAAGASRNFDQAFGAASAL